MDHTFPKTGRQIFFPKGLDRDSRKSLVGQISLQQYTVLTGFCLKAGVAIGSSTTLETQPIAGSVCETD